MMNPYRSGRAVLNKVLIVTAFSFLSLVGRADAEQRFGIDHYLALEDLSEIAVSPDGRFVAATSTLYDLKTDDFGEVVWMVPTAGGTPVRMTNTDSRSDSPKWSPDGRYLAVRSKRKDDTWQVWLLDRRGGDAQQLTTFKQGIRSFEWSPDSKSMLLLVSDPAPADLDEEERPNPRPYVVDRLQFKQDYFGYLDRNREHVHIIDLESRETRQVTFGDYDDSEPTWAPDGRQIVFVSNRTDEPDTNRNTDLWIVDVTEEKPEPRQLTLHETADASPRWSPDGKLIAYTSTNPDSILPIYAIPQLTIVDVATGDVTVVETLRETQPFALDFTPDSQSLIAIMESRGEQNLVKVDIRTGAAQSLVDGSDVVDLFAGVTTAATRRNFCIDRPRPQATELCQRKDPGRSPTGYDRKAPVCER